MAMITGNNYDVRENVLLFEEVTHVRCVSTAKYHVIIRKVVQSKNTQRADIIFGQSTNYNCIILIHEKKFYETYEMHDASLTV